MNNRRPTGVADNPVLVGTATVLLAVLLVLFAYNANAGLPFVPAYRISADVPSGANLLRGNDVRIGGTRVGVVTALRPVSRGDKTWARLDLKLDKKIAPLPVDSTLLVRPRSPIGLKYLEITEGRSDQDLPEGGVFPLKNATPLPVELDEFLNTFNDRARRGSQETLSELGTGLAGRGVGINETLDQLKPLLVHVEPLMRQLTDPEARFDRFFVAGAQLMDELGPAAPEFDELLVNFDLTFSALASVGEPIKQSLERAPGALTTFTDALPRERPFIRNIRGLVDDIKPGTKYLPKVTADLADATEFGAPGLRHVVRTSPKLDRLFRTVDSFTSDPLTKNGLGGLKTLTATVRQPLAFITPSQTVCNYAGLLFRNLASALSDNDGIGGWLRFVPVIPEYAVNSEFGPAGQTANAASGALHTNPYPNTAAPGQTRECESGNEDFSPAGQALGNPPTNEGTVTQKTEPVPDPAAKK